MQNQAQRGVTYITDKAESSQLKTLNHCFTGVLHLQYGRMPGVVRTYGTWCTGVWHVVYGSKNNKKMSVSHRHTHKNKTNIPWLRSNHALPPVISVVQQLRPSQQDPMWLRCGRPCGSDSQDSMHAPKHQVRREDLSRGAPDCRHLPPW